MHLKELFQTIPKLQSDKKICLLTHNDADGSGCAILIRYLFPDADIIHCSNQNASRTIRDLLLSDEKRTAYDFILATDISVTEQDAVRLNGAFRYTRKFLMLDHHTSALSLNQYKWAVITPDLPKDSAIAHWYPENSQPKTSGTALLYDYLIWCGLLPDLNDQPSPVARLLNKIVHFIAAYDNWNWVTILGGNPEYDEFHQLHECYGIRLYEDQMLTKIKNDNPVHDYSTDLFDSTDCFLLGIHKDKVKTHLEHIQPSIRTGNLQINDRYYSIVFLSNHDYMQETFQFMKDTYPDYDLYAMDYGTGCSLRAVKPEIDVSAILQPLGGGGHQGAGGIRYKPEEIHKLFADTFHGTLFLDASERTAI